MRIQVEREERSEGSRHWLRVRKSAQPDLDIFFDFIGEHDVALPQVADGCLHAVIHRAMMAGEEVCIEAPVSRQALHNLGEYQDAMHAFYPDLCRRVSIRAHDIVDSINKVSAPRAIACFSGGVDSSFTILRQRLALQDGSAWPIQGALLIDQLRKNCVEEGAFTRLIERVRPFCDELGIRLHVARTNLRKVLAHKYLHNIGAQLASALQNYSHCYDYGLVPSGDSYVSLILPFGTSPVTDHLLSGAAMRIVHEGSGFTRTEKVAMLAQYPAALKALHVCLKHPYRNCGECMKCVRTRLNLLAVGISQIEAFPDNFRLELIDGVRLNLTHVVDELRTILDYAARHNVKADWTEHLRKHLEGGAANQANLPRTMGLLSKIRSRLRAKPILSQLGLKHRLGAANPILQQSASNELAAEL